MHHSEIYLHLCKVRFDPRSLNTVPYRCFCSSFPGLTRPMSIVSNSLMPGFCKSAATTGSYISDGHGVWGIFVGPEKWSNIDNKSQIETQKTNRTRISQHAPGMNAYFPSYITTCNCPHGYSHSHFVPWQKDLVTLAIDPIKWQDL